MLDIKQAVAKPIEIEKELKILFSNNGPNLILDIGACTGESSLQYSNLFPNSKIVAFEPLISNIEVMKMHFEQFGKSHIKIIQTALSDRVGEADFFVSGGDILKGEGKESDYTSMSPKEWNKSSSLLPPSDNSAKIYPWLKFEKKIRVKTNTLKNFIYENEISTIDFIHLDVQGAELQVLEGLGEKINTVYAVWLEVENVEMYKNQPLKNSIFDFMKKNHFALMKDTSVGGVYGDCLFVNKNKISLFKRILIKYFA